MKIVVSPYYSHLKEYIRTIPYDNYKCDKAFRNRRNTVHKITAPDGTELVIKRFKRPSFAARIAYTFLSTSIAKRSFMSAGKLCKSGIQTAEQVAYIEVYEWGFFHTGYYITRFVPDRVLTDVNTLHGEERETVLHHFAQFVCDLHLKGIKHGDFNAGNIFFRWDKERYIFTLIDIDQMQFQYKLSKKTCMKEFQRLLSRKDMITVAERYAMLRGWNIDRFCVAILLVRGSYLIGKLKRFLHTVINRIK
jgi:hypothetical protein